jgi:Flp pilus assembly protein TadD
VLGKPYFNSFAISLAILATIVLKADRGILKEAKFHQSEGKSMTELLKLAQSVMKEERWHEAITLLKENPSVVEKHWELLWNLGWCYFKLKRMDDARKFLTKAMQLAPKNHICKFGLGQVYLKKKQYKKAERILSEALQIKESHTARISLALAYLAQGKIGEAENTHLENIKLRPKKSERYEAYADFLSDVGREGEAEKMYRRARELQRIN